MKISQLFIGAITLSAAVSLFGCDDGGGGGGGSGGAGAQGGAGGSGAQAGSGGSGAQAGSGGSGAQGGSGGASALKLYTTCGDPSCSGAMDDPNVPNCVAQMEGDACQTADETCELQSNDCNQNLICAASDPKEQTGGCPISLASAKHDIEYITDKERDRIRDEVMTMPLATWKYNDESRGEKEHLGFIIDDQPPSSAAVRSSGQRVDLYGYTSMAVAAIQAQNKELASLREEIATLRQELRQAKAIECSQPVSK